MSESDGFEDITKDETGLQEIDYSPENVAQSILYINTISTGTLIFSSLLFLGFIIIHLFATFRTPTMVSTKKDFYKLNITGETNITNNVDITVSDLSDLHRFLDVNCTIIRNQTREARVLPLEVDVKVTTSQNNSNNVENVNHHFKTEVSFDRRVNESTSMHLFHIPIRDVDSASIALTYATDFINISGISFLWSFSDPGASKYCRSVGFLMFLLIAYFGIVFVINADYSQETFSQIFILIDGVIALFALFPYHYIADSIIMTHIARHVLLAIFVALFRLYLLLMFQTIADHSHTPPLFLSVLLGIFFGFYATVDASASFDRTERETAQIGFAEVLQTENLLLGLHCVYALLVAIFMIRALMKNRGYAGRSIYFFVFDNLYTLFVTFLTQIPQFARYFFVSYEMPGTLFLTAYATSIAFSLFYFHSEHGHDYKQVDDDIENASDAIDVNEGLMDSNDDELLSDHDKEQ